MLKFIDPLFQAPPVHTEYRLVFSGKRISESILQNRTGTDDIRILSVVFDDPDELLTHGFRERPVHDLISKFSGKFKIPCLCSLLYPCIPQIVINEICIIQIRSGIERIMRFENLTDIGLLISYDRSGKQHSTCLSPDHTGSYHMIPYGKIILRRKVLLYHLTHLIISCHHDLAHLGAFVCYIHSAFPKQFDPVEISVP